MATEQGNFITVNQPFYSLEPLTDYLTSLDTVTTQPTEETISRLMAADATLTSRTVLYPQTDYVHNEGYRIFGYRSCTVSDGVEVHAHLALFEPGTEAYYQEHARLISFPGKISVNWVDGKPQVEMESHPAPREWVKPDGGSKDRRANAARGALIALGGHLAVSGAFTAREIEPAYEAIKASLVLLGENSTEEEFAMFGLKRISRGLLNQQWWIQRDGARHNPIGRQEAMANIRQAWRVVGRPYGKFSGLRVLVADKPHF